MRKPVINTEGIVNFIKSSKEPVNKKQILEATNYPGDYKYAMRVILKNHDDIERIGDKFNACYRYNPKTVENEKEVSVMKNPEGYPDRTAGKAIANVMRSSNGGRYPMRQSVGEIWTSSNLIDDQEGFLVVSAKEGVCICYNVYPTKKSFMKPDYTMRWTDDIGHTHFISTINPVNLSERKLLRKIGTIGAGEKECLKTSVLNALSIDIPEAQEKVKIVKVNDPITEKRLNEALSQNEKLSKEVENLKKSQSEVKLNFDAESIEREARLTEEIEKLKSIINEKDKEIEFAVLQAKCDIYEKLLFDKGNPYLNRLRSAS